MNGKIALISLYDSLEQEVIAKGKIQQTDKEILELLQSARTDNHALKEEIVEIQQSYQLEEADFEITNKLAKRVDELFKRFELLEHKVNSNMASFSHFK